MLSCVLFRNGGLGSGASQNRGMVNSHAFCAEREMAWLQLETLCTDRQVSNVKFEQALQDSCVLSRKYERMGLVCILEGANALFESFEEMLLGMENIFFLGSILSITRLMQVVLRYYNALLVFGLQAFGLIDRVGGCYRGNMIRRNKIRQSTRHSNCLIVHLKQNRQRRGRLSLPHAIPYPPQINVRL